MPISSSLKTTIRQQPRAFTILGAMLIAAGIGVASPLLQTPSIPAALNKRLQAGQLAESQIVTGELQKGTPDYDTVLPSGKTITDYGGWTRVSPPNRDPVYAYADKLNGTPINVSQQPLPKDFTDQTSEQIQLLAQGYSANKKLNVNGALVYLGTSAKGPQSVIVVKGKLLILIKASAAIADEEWKNYIQSLG